MVLRPMVILNDAVLMNGDVMWIPEGSKEHSYGLLLKSSLIKKKAKN